MEKARGFGGEKNDKMRVKKFLSELGCFLFFVLVLSNFVTSIEIDNSEEKIFFDIKIVEFNSPVKLGEFFEFTYSLRGIFSMDEDIGIKFGIEKDNEIISSGLDTVYIGNSKEKIETTKLFLPSTVESGIYQFYIELNHDGYSAKSYRTIEIEVKGGIAIINPIKIEGNFKTYIIAFLIGLSVFILSFIFYLERRKIKKEIIQEKQLIIKHKISILTLILFIVFGFLIYYLNLVEFIAKSFSKINLIYIWMLFSLISLIIIWLNKRKILSYFEKWKNTISHSISLNKILMKLFKKSEK